MRLAAPIAALALAALAAPAAALEAQQRVLKQETVTQPDGTETVSYVQADLVVPGETIVYALVFRNDEAVAAQDVVLVMPVPAEVAFVEGSAMNRLATPEFSADGGTRFAAREALRVSQADGTARAATSDDITHVRWRIAQPIQPGQTGQLWFKGVLR